MKRSEFEAMSQAEFDEYLDGLVRAGREDTVEFQRAYRFWERTYGD